MPGNELSVVDSREEATSPASSTISYIKMLFQGRWLWVACGLVCVAYGQYLITQPDAQTWQILGVQEWGERYRLGIANLASVVVALLFFLVGGVICAWKAFPQTGFNQVHINKRSSPSNNINWKPVFALILPASLLYFFLMARLAKHEYRPYFVIIWLTAIGLLTILAWYVDKKGGIFLSLGLTRIDLALLLILTAGGLAICAFFLRDVPVMMIGDDGAFWDVARMIASKALQPPFFDSGVYTFPVASSIWQGLVMRWSESTLWGWRYSSVIAGVITTIPLYLLALECFNRRVAVVACIIMLTNPYFLSFSRLGYNNIQALFPVVASIYLFVLGLRRSSYFYFWLAGLAAGLGFYTYSAAMLGLAVIIFSLIFQLIDRKRSSIHLPGVGAVILLSWAIVTAPHIVFVITGRDPGSLVNKIFQTSFFSTYNARAIYSGTELIQAIKPIKIGFNEIFFDARLYGELFVRGGIRTLVDLFSPFVVHEHYVTTGTAGAIAPIFFSIGLFLALRSWKNIHSNLLIIWFFLSIVVLSILSSFPPRHTHMVVIIPVLALLTGIGAVTCSETLLQQCVERYNLIKKYGGFVLIMAGAFIPAAAGLYQFFVVMPQNYPPTFDGITAWIATRTTTPISIVFIEHTTSNHWIGYQVSTKMVPHQFAQFDTPSFLTNPSPLLNPQATLAFFDEDPGGQISKRLINLMSNAGQPVEYTNAAGNVIGYAVTNTKADLQPKMTFANGLTSLIETPVIYPLGILFFLLLALGFYSFFMIRYKPLQSINSPAAQLKPSFSINTWLSRPLPSLSISIGDRVTAIKVLMVAGLLLIFLNILLVFELQSEQFHETDAFLFIGFLLLTAGLWLQITDKGVSLNTFIDPLGAWLGVSHGQAISLLISLVFAVMASVIGTIDGGSITFLAIKTIAWSMALLLVIIGVVQVSPRRDKSTWRCIIPIAVILTIAFTVRVVLLSHIPVIWAHDEITNGLRVVDWLLNNRNATFAASWHDFSFYLQALSIGIGGQSISALRLTSAIGGALTVGAVYVTSRLLFNQRTATLAAIFMIGFHAHVHLSRLGLNLAWIGLGYLVTLGAMWYGWSRNNRSAYLLAGLAIGLSLYFGNSARYLPWLVSLWIIYAYLSEREQARQHTAHFFVMGIAALIVALPIFTLHLVELRVVPATIHTWFEEITARGILDHAIRGLGSYIYDDLSSPWYQPGTPLLRTFPAALFIVGFVMSLLRLRDLRSQLLIIWLVLFGVIIGWNKSTPDLGNYAGVIPACAILIAYGIEVILSLLEKRYPLWSRILGVFVFVIVSVMTLDDLRFYFLEYTLNTDKVNLTAETRKDAIAQRLAETLSHYTTGWKVIFLGNGNLRFGSLEAVQYLTPQLPGFDAEKQWSPADNLQPAGNQLMFVSLPARNNELALVRQNYPSGLSVTLRRGVEDILYLYQYPGNPYQYPFSAWDTVPHKPDWLSTPAFEIVWAFVIITLLAILAAISGPPKKPETEVGTNAEGNRETLNGDVGFKSKLDRLRSRFISLSDKNKKEPAETLSEEFVEDQDKQSAASEFPAGTQGTVLATLREKVKSVTITRDTATVLFTLALIIYLATRLIGLTRFPIYFFTDEAIQTQSIADLIKNDYRDQWGTLLPTYFQNGTYFNLSVSVYLQWLPYMLWGKSAEITRATSVLVTLIAAIAAGIVLKEAFKLKYWWLGTLFLSITPAWFLHSRTAFETSEYVAFYSGSICAYLLYRYKSPRYLYLSLLLAALAFYTYSAGQVVVTVTAILLVASDWRYHWQNRRTLAWGVLFLFVLVLPYLRFRLGNPNAPLSHLREMFSYIFDPIPLSDKIKHYMGEYTFGLSPAYWYVPNDRDLLRHLMKGYGNLMLMTLPFAVIGLANILRNLRQSAHRTILIALVAAPAGSALVSIGITRVLSFVFPAAIVTSIGFEKVLNWIADPGSWLVGLREGPSPTRWRIVAGAVILVAGATGLIIAGPHTNGVVTLFLAMILAFQVSGFATWIARMFSHDLPRWKFHQGVIGLAAFVLLATTNVAMLRDALVNGPLWFNDYGMGGAQYGAFQIFDIIKAHLKAHPDAKIILTPNWANGADVLLRFYMGDGSPLEMGSIEGYITEKFPLDESMLFIMTPEEYDKAKTSPKLTDIRVEQSYPFPNGQPGFYFVHLRYVDNIDEIFATEKAARSILQKATVTIANQPVEVRYSYLDMGEIRLLFDDDTYTFCRTFEANPFVVELTYPAPQTIKGFSIIVGSIQAKISMKLYADPDSQPIEFTFEGQGSIQQPQLSFDLPQATQAKVIRVELQDVNTKEPTHVHIWELTFR
jgi:4-amino-4-deoxy-L-arabinose transferase-like glycosyltransferase